MYVRTVLVDRLLLKWVDVPTHGTYGPRHTTRTIVLLQYVLCLSLEPVSPRPIAPARPMLVNHAYLPYVESKSKLSLPSTKFVLIFDKKNKMATLLLGFLLVLFLYYTSLSAASNSRCKQYTQSTTRFAFAPPRSRGENRINDINNDEVEKNNNNGLTFIARLARGGADYDLQGEEVVDRGDLDTKVYAAMKKLGLMEGDDGNTNGNKDDERQHKTEDASREQQSEEEGEEMVVEGTTSSENDGRVADQIMEEFQSQDYVTKPMVLAALAASGGNVTMAREILRYEVQLVSHPSAVTSSDTAEGGVDSYTTEQRLLQTLLAEGKYEKTRIQRALALTDYDLPNARAILDAELEDEAEEAQQNTAITYGYYPCRL